MNRLLYKKYAVIIIFNTAFALELKKYEMRFVINGVNN